MQGIVVLSLALIPLTYLLWRAAAGRIKPASSGDRNHELSATLSRLHHLAIAITFLLAVGRLLLIHGCTGTALVCFLGVPTLALMVAIADDSRWNKRIAEWFLLAAGACVINGWFHFLPRAFQSVSESASRRQPGPKRVPVRLPRLPVRHRAALRFDPITLATSPGRARPVLASRVLALSRDLGGDRGRVHHQPERSATELIKTLKRQMLK